MHRAKAFFFVCAGLLLVPVSAFPATTPPATPAQQQHDVLGWRDARWGMTNEQVALAFAGQVVKSDSAADSGSQYTLYTIPKYLIEDVVYNVQFRMDKTSHGLNEVILMSGDPKAHLIYKVQFEAAERLLTQRYGPATFAKDDHGDDGFMTLARMWAFPTTTIELTLYYFPIVNGGSVVITYHPTKTADADKL